MLVASRIARHTRAVASVLAVTVTVLVASSFVSPAAALPPGAYWYTYYDLPTVWKTDTGAGVTVAVIDSGVQASPGDLQGQVLAGTDLSGQGSAQQDMAVPGTNGLFGHGSATAALIAGTGKGGGMVGVAPSAKILPVRVQLGSDNDAEIVGQGIRYAVDHGAQIINLSLGGPGPCNPAEGAAIRYAYEHDIIVVASAADTPGPVETPADCPGALAVGGVDAQFASWPNTPSGPEVSFVAPSVNLVNEQLDNTVNAQSVNNAGTSQAAALVSGVFALIRSKFPQDSARQIVTRALYAVHNGLGPGHLSQRISDKLGYGEILPKFAISQSLPAGAQNPIYDRFAAALGTGTTGGSSGSPTTASSAPSTPGAPSSTPAASGNDGSGPGTPAWQYILGAAVLIALITGIALLLGRRGRRRPPPGGPPPGYSTSAYSPPSSYGG